MMLNIMISLLAALWCFSILMAILSRRSREKDTLNNRMAYFAGVDVSLRHIGQSYSHAGGGNLQQRLYDILHRIAAKFARIKKCHSLDLKMQQAGLPLLGSEFQVIMLVFATLGALLLGILSMDLVNALLGFAIGGLVCMMMLSVAIKRRKKAFVNQLGDMLTMIANALRAGFSFMQALDHIANEMADPVRSEVQRVIRDVNIGMPLEDALDNMNRRIDSPDFNLVVAAVLIQRQVGGNLAQILDTISDTINERVKMRQEVNTLTAQGKLSGMVLAALPFAVTLIFQIIAPGYLKPLYTNPVGQMAAAGAVLLMVVGFVVIRRIVDIQL